MAKKVNVVLDTNIIISALGFGGRPREVLNLVLNEKIKAILSSALLAEFDDVVTKKFPVLAQDLEKIHKELKEYMEFVKPKSSIRIVRDESDNRVLEAAIEGNCDYIITGDKDLLDIKIYKNIRILKPDDFLSNRED